MDYNLCMADESFPSLFDESGEAFERMAKENGKRTWSARKLMASLGYEKWAAFKKIIDKAMAACALLGIRIFDHFAPATYQINGKEVEDYALSRFACCMTALNGDSSNRAVAAAQAYFVSLAEFIADQRIEHAESMDRLAIREEISEREITLSETAAAAGVESYADLRIAGYLGMYEMDYQTLRRMRGLSSTPKRSLLDFMGKDELAANLFRLTLTEGRIRKEKPRGQWPLEKVARDVGRRVRRTMHEETGFFPEELPTAQDIREVRKGLKRAGNEFAPLDDLNRQREIEEQTMNELLPLRSEDAVPGCSLCAAGDPSSHNGSPHCTSGSLASGGTVAHCKCDQCY